MIIIFILTILSMIKYRTVGVWDIEGMVDGNRRRTTREFSSSVRRKWNRLRAWGDVEQGWRKQGWRKHTVPAEGGGGGGWRWCMKRAVNWGGSDERRPRKSSGRILVRARPPRADGTGRLTSPRGWAGRGGKAKWPETNYDLKGVAPYREIMKSGCRNATRMFWFVFRSLCDANRAKFTAEHGSAIAFWYFERFGRRAFRVFLKKSYIVK